MRDKIAKDAANAASEKVVQVEANKNEKEKRKRDSEKKEKRKALEGKAVLDGKKVNAVKCRAGPVKPVKNPKGRTTEVDKMTKRINKRLELVAEKANKLEMDMQAKREKLISEGVTPKILEDDSSETGSGDMDWDCGLWKVADHAVEWKTAKPNFKVITGIRAVSAGHATEKWVWGQREALGMDDFDVSVLDKCVEENCDHPVYQKNVPRVVRRKKTVMPVEQPKKKKECDHSSFDLGLSYHPDPEVNPGWCAAGKFLFGVECAGCGSPFVQKADSEDKNRGAPQVPSTANAVCCCNNLRHRNGTSGDGCDHACCRRCWDEGLLAASNSGVRTSRRAR